MVGGGGWTRVRAASYQRPSMTSVVVPRQRRQLLDELQLDREVSRHTGGLILTIVVLGATYGAVLGAWHGPKLAAYVAIKIPLMLLVTAAITALFNWIVAALLGVPLRLRQIVGLTLLPLAVTAAVAASLAPVAWLFTHSLPPPSEAQRTLHNLLYLTHTILIAAAGLAGTGALRRALLEVCGADAARAFRIRASWVAVYALVGGEVAWALRPFVGSVYLPVVFLREDALNGNVYEFILTDILPHLWSLP
jgi:hypothetical protein